MPYRRANYFVGFVLAVIIIGFWPSYYSEIGDVPLAFHMHATTAILWVLLLMAQVWSIHSGRSRLHRSVGKASLALFPLLIMGFVSIINVSAARYVAGDGPFINHLGPSFGVGMAMAIAAYVVLYYQALRNRRTIPLHAGYMLMTPVVLFESPFSRILLDHFPQLIFTSTAPPQIIIDAIVISMGLAVLFCLALYALNRRYGAPFLLTAGIITAQAVVMYVAPGIGWIRVGFEAYAQIPQTATLAGGFVIGAVTAWLGWRGAPRAGASAAANPAE